jgi:hypothetical protein
MRKKNESEIANITHKDRLQSIGNAISFAKKRVSQSQTSFIKAQRATKGLGNGLPS